MASTLRAYSALVLRSWVSMPTSSFTVHLLSTMSGGACLSIRDAITRFNQAGGAARAAEPLAAHTRPQNREASATRGGGTMRYTDAGEEHVVAPEALRR